MGLKRSVVVDGDRPIVAEANKCAQQHLREARTVLAYGPKTTILTKGAVGVVVHVHLQKQTTKTLLTHCNHPGKQKQ
jgi:hypothetical protein